MEPFTPHNVHDLSNNWWIPQAHPVWKDLDRRNKIPVVAGWQDGRPVLTQPAPILLQPAVGHMGKCGFCGAQAAFPAVIIHHQSCVLLAPPGLAPGAPKKKAMVGRDDFRARAPTHQSTGSNRRIPWSELPAEERSNVERGQLAAEFHQKLRLECRRCGADLVDGFTAMCGNRLCGRCAHRRSRRPFQRLQTRLAGVPQSRDMRLLTLTVKSTPYLNTSLAVLSEAFAGLRHLAVWKRWVKAGFKVLEVTRPVPGWHAHLHVLIHVPNGIPYQRLRETWERLTNGSMVVDFRRCYGSLEQVGRYVGKYMGKGIGELQSTEQETEYRYETKNRRLYSCLGAWYASNGAIYRGKRPERICLGCGWVDVAVVGAEVPVWSLIQPQVPEGHPFGVQ